MPSHLWKRFWRSLLCVVLGLLCGWVLSARAGDSTDIALRMLVEELVKGVQAQQDADIDTALCLDLQVPAALHRRVQLGLLSNATDSTMLGQLNRAYRTAVSVYVAEMLRRGQYIESIDTSGVHLGVPGDRANEMLHLSEHPNDAVEITAQGIVTIQLRAIREPVDISVSRFGERWCLQPVAVP